MAEGLEIPRSRLTLFCTVSSSKTWMREVEGVSCVQPGKGGCFPPVQVVRNANAWAPVHVWTEGCQNQRIDAETFPLSLLER